MHRIAVVILMLSLLAGCGPDVRSSVPPNSDNNNPEQPLPIRPAQPVATTDISINQPFLTLNSITMNESVNFSEEGLAIFVHVTSAKNPAIGSTTRYPEDGVVLSFEENRRHTLQPNILIPVQEGVKVDVVVIAVPRLITNEALNLIGFAIGEVISILVPEMKLYDVLKRFILGRASNEVIAYLQAGRIVGVGHISAQNLAMEKQLRTNEFVVYSSILDTSLSPVTITIEDSLGATQINEQIVIAINGQPTVSLTVDRDHPKSFGLVTLPRAGKYTYDLEGDALFDVQGQKWLNGKGSGTIEVTNGKFFHLIGDNSYNLALAEGPATVETPNEQPTEMPFLPTLEPIQSPVSLSPDTATPVFETPIILQPNSVSASAFATDSFDSQGNTTTFIPENAVDGRLDTAWRVEGDGLGQYIEFAFNGLVRIDEIKIVPGYAKIDASDGTNRFIQNRRVRSVRITFSDGSSTNVKLNDEPQYQQISLQSPVVTTYIRITILETTEPGSNDPRNFTAISEVTLIGAIQTR